MYKCFISLSSELLKLSYKDNDNGIWFLIIFAAIVAIIFIIGIIVNIKDKIWDEPQNKINTLKKENQTLQCKINDLQNQLSNLLNLSDKTILFNNSEKYNIPVFIDKLTNYSNADILRLLKISDFIFYFESNNLDEHKIYYFIETFWDCNKSDISKLLKLSNTLSKATTDTLKRTINIIKKSDTEVFNELILLRNRVKFLESTTSNLSAIPYMSQIIADYETYGIEHLARELNWGYSEQRLSKVKSIREIRKDAKAMVYKNKEAQYQLSYLLELYPALQDVIECDYKQLPIIKVEELSEYDTTRDYLSKEEYQNLSVTERNQLALDRYKSSHNKSKWQIGRDYELYIGYKYTLKGYSVDYFGSYMGLEDLGRDLIAKKDGKTLIIQCKYWSSKKQIHEKHITQLYGTMMSYCVEHEFPKSSVSGVLITNITLSPMAKKMANFLKIKYKENVNSGDYPCIKCNIGHNEYGETKIYHLPFDQKYDATKIDKQGEFYAMTVAEAEEAGFRRAFKWFGN